MSNWQDAPIVENTWQDAEIIETKTKSEKALLEGGGFSRLGQAGEGLVSVGRKMIAEPVAGMLAIPAFAAGLQPAYGGSIEKATDYGVKTIDNTKDLIGGGPAESIGGQAVEQGIGKAGEMGVKAVRAPFAGVAGLAKAPFVGLDEAANTVNRTMDEGIGPTAGGALADIGAPPIVSTIAHTLPTAVATVAGAKSPAKGTTSRRSRLDVADDVDSSIPEFQEPALAQQAIDGVSVGRPRLDNPVDFTPAETIIESLRKGKSGDVADAVIPDAQIIESAQRMNVNLNPEHYSTNAAFQDVARALKTQPGSALQVNEVAALAVISRRADDLIERNSGFLDKAEFSQEIGSEIGTSIDDLARQADAAYESVRGAIPAQTKVNTRLIRDFIDRKLADFGGDASQLSKVEKQLLALTRRTKEGNPIAPTYAALDNIRRNVGAGFNRSGPFKDGVEGNLREVYSVLSDVQDGVARSFGAGDLYAGARSLVSRRKALEDQAVQLFGRNISGSLVPKIRGASTAIVKGDVSKFNQLIHALPAGRRAEAAATVVGDIFSGGSRRGGELSTGFSSSWQALNRNKTAKDALFSYLPPASRRSFDDIGRIVTGIVESNRRPLGNPSGTAGGIIKALDDLSFVEKAYGFTKQAAAAEGVSTSIGLPGAGTAGVVGTMLAKQKTPIIVAADEMLASPAFSRAINRAIDGDVNGANRMIEATPEFSRWSAHITQKDALDIARIGFISWIVSEDNKQ